jgi:hypothetical protein
MEKLGVSGPYFRALCPVRSAPSENLFYFLFARSPHSLEISITSERVLRTDKGTLTNCNDHNVRATYIKSLYCGCVQPNVVILGT